MQSVLKKSGHAELAILALAALLFACLFFAGPAFAGADSSSRSRAVLTTRHWAADGSSSQRRPSSAWNAGTGSRRLTTTKVARSS